MVDLPKKIAINEEGPREGFQIEKTPISTASKIELIDALAEAGLKHIQTVSFVNPKKVPGWADADEVVRGMKAQPDVEFTALWLNPRGFERALAHRDKLTLTGAIKMGASEPFLVRNQGTTFAENLAMQRQQVANYLAHNVPVTGIGMNAAFGCNFGGEVPVSRVLEAIGQALDIARDHGVNPRQVRLSDTMAWAIPGQIKQFVGAVQDKYPEMQVHLHLHNTRGMAIANAVAGLEMGVDSYDSSIAGIGGCPFAGHAGAAGNICTEDLVFLCDEMGIDTGIDIDKVLEAARLAERVFGRQLPGSVVHGGTLKRFRAAA